MSDLISRQAAVDTLLKIDCSDGVGISALKCDAVDDAVTAIKALPTVDAVRYVVRCGECRYADWHSNGCIAYCTKHGSDGWTDDDFCSYGEDDKRHETN